MLNIYQCTIFVGSLQGGTPVKMHKKQPVFLVTENDRKRLKMTERML